jgi:hypothetical protein
MRIKLDQVMQFDELLLLHGRGTARSTSHFHPHVMIRRKHAMRTTAPAKTRHVRSWACDKPR